MSNRVMALLEEMAPRTQQYSVDECFLDLTTMRRDLVDYGHHIRHHIKKCAGIPVSVGIAETKTLAKLVNNLAKASVKSNGVISLIDTNWHRKALEKTSIGNVWGIGRQYAKNSIASVLRTPMTSHYDRTPG